MFQHMEDHRKAHRGGGRGPGRGKGRGRGRGGNRPEAPVVSREDLSAWFVGSLPDDWFTEPVAVVFDRDEILVTGQLPTPKIDDAQSSTVAEEARIEQHRESTREQRIAIAARAQEKFGRIVSWGATCGESTVHFTTASVPAMTRLHLQERQILDTLIDAGVARSRSEALAWCVKIVGDNESEWIGELRTALEAVEAARNKR